MNEYWVVIENTTGRIIAHCGEENDAILMVAFNPHNRVHRRQRFMMDYVIDVSSIGIKELPGQQGLPAAKNPLPQFHENIYLPAGSQVSFNP